MKFIFKFFFLLFITSITSKINNDEVIVNGTYCFGGFLPKVSKDCNDYPDNDLYNSARRLQQKNFEAYQVTNITESKVTFLLTSIIYKKTHFFSYLVEPILAAFKLKLYLFHVF